MMLFKAPSTFFWTFVDAQVSSIYVVWCYRYICCLMLQVCCLMLQVCCMIFAIWFLKKIQTQKIWDKKSSLEVRYRISHPVKLKFAPQVPDGAKLGLLAAAQPAGHSNAPAEPVRGRGMWQVWKGSASRGRGKWQVCRGDARGPKTLPKVESVPPICIRLPIIIAITIFEWRPLASPSPLFPSKK